MELDGEGSGRPSHAAAVAGAFLGGALGADCFLAVGELTGLPAFLCGAALAFWAVTGGELLAGRRSRAGALLALPFILLWSLLANHRGFALAAAPGDPGAVWAAFASLEAARDLRYWLQLSGLAGTALAVWVMLFLRARREERLADEAAQPCRSVPESTPTDMEFFLPSQQWIRPIHVWMQTVRCICLALVLLCGWISAMVGHGEFWTSVFWGVLVGFMFLHIGQGRGRSGRICEAGSVLFVRTGDELWRVDMKSVRDPELNVPLAKLARIWDRLPVSRQKLFRSAVAKAVKERIGISRTKSPDLEHESRWEWRIADLHGGRWVIPKVYPNFAPVPGVERTKGPLPLAWNEVICIPAVMLVCAAAGCYLGIEAEQRAADVPTPPPQVETVLPDPVHSSPADPGPVTTARVPQEIGYYYLNGLTLQTDNAFSATTNELLDQKTGVEYQLSLRYGVGEAAARAVLGEEGEFLRPDSGELLWRMGENSVVYQYNLRTLTQPEGQTLHTGAALSERGTMLIVEASHGGDVDKETVRGDLLYMLENLQFTGPAITGENYQEQLRPAVNMGFNYCGQAFLKAPPRLFGYDAFIDTFLPCGGALNYYDDGLSVMTSVHGLRVSAAIVPCDGTAKDALDGIYQDLKAAGRRYDEQNLYEDAYSEEDNTACIATVYYDGGRTRATVMYAIGKWEGYYLFKEMTCLPEEIDSEYPAVFKEMEASSGISVPHMETMGRFSQ